MGWGSLSHGGSWFVTESPSDVGASGRDGWPWEVGLGPDGRGLGGHSGAESVLLQPVSLTPVALGATAPDGPPALKRNLGSSGPCPLGSWGRCGAPRAAVGWEGQESREVLWTGRGWCHRKTVTRGKV